MGFLKEMNLPNKLTLTRILLSPIFMLFILIENQYARMTAFGIFTIACLTDLWDGYLARKNGCVTGFGRFMDPMADKLLVSLAFISFISLGIIPAWIVLVIIGREILILGLRMLVAYKGEAMKSSPLAKLKTASQMISASLLLAYISIKSSFSKDGIFGMEIQNILVGIVIGAMVLTVVSGIDYVYKNRMLIYEQMSKLKL